MAFDLELTAMTAFCEASNASPKERRCVVHVIANRLSDGRFGSTLAEVCLHRIQFSEWNDDKVNNENLRRAARVSDTDPVLLDCLDAVVEVKNGSFDPTAGATHYHDKSVAPPAWTVGATMTLTTGKFLFYRNVR